MKTFFASLAVVFLISGISVPAAAAGMQTLAEQHAAYAQYLFKDKWQEHLPEVSENWKKSVGGLDISKADTPREFDNFFSFVIRTDPEVAPAFERAKWSLEKVESHFGALEQEADDGDRERFRHDLEMGMTHTKELTDIVLQLQTKLL